MTTSRRRFTRIQEISWRCAESKSKEDNNQNLYRKEVTKNQASVISDNFQLAFGWSSPSLLHAKIEYTFDVSRSGSWCGNSIDDHYRMDIEFDFVIFTIPLIEGNDFFSVIEKSLQLKFSHKPVIAIVTFWGLSASENLCYFLRFKLQPK